MRKLALVSAAVFFMACGGDVQTVEVSVSDTVLVDSLKADSVALDSISVDTLGVLPVDSL